MEVMLDCQKLNRNIPRLKWCEPILSAVTRLMDSAIEYTAKHFVSLLNSGKLRDIDKVTSLRTDCNHTDVYNNFSQPHQMIGSQCINDSFDVSVFDLCHPSVPPF